MIRINRGGIYIIVLAAYKPVPRYFLPIFPINISIRYFPFIPFINISYRYFPPLSISIDIFPPFYIYIIIPYISSILEKRYIDIMQALKRTKSMLIIKNWSQLLIINIPESYIIRIFLSSFIYNKVIKIYISSFIKTKKFIKYIIIF